MKKELMTKLKPIEDVIMQHQSLLQTVRAEIQQLLSMERSINESIDILQTKFQDETDEIRQYITNLGYQYTAIPNLVHEFQSYDE